MMEESRQFRQWEPGRYAYGVMFTPSKARENKDRCPDYAVVTGPLGFGELHDSDS